MRPKSHFDLRIAWRYPPSAARGISVAPAVLPEISLAAPEVEGPSGAEGVVAHGEMLRVVPKRGHGISVVVAHHQARTLAEIGTWKRG